MMERPAKPASSLFPTSAKLSQDDALDIVENDIQRWNSETGTKYGVDYRITDIAVNVPKFANYTPSYVSFEEFKERDMKLPVVYVSSNGTVIHVLENGTSEYVGECHTGLLTYCGYRPPFELGYEERLVYGVEILALSRDNPKVPLFFLVDAMNGQIVDSTFVRGEHDIGPPFNEN
jgi:hypothetical protein